MKKHVDLMDKDVPIAIGDKFKTKLPFPAFIVLILCLVATAILMTSKWTCKNISHDPIKIEKAEKKGL